MSLFRVFSRAAGAVQFVTHVDGARFRAIFLECGTENAAYAAQISAALHMATANAVEAADENWPSVVASRLDGELRRLPLDGGANAIFAAVELTRSAVNVCTAGDLRVSMIEEGGELQSTADHTFAKDPLAPPHAELSAHLASSLASRWLGGVCAGPPESTRWLATCQYQVFVTSSGYHRWRDSSMYGPAEMQDDIAGVAGQPGLIAFMSVTP